MIKNVVIAAVLLAALGGCAGKKAASAGQEMNLIFGPEPNTIDPALNTATDGAVYLVHLFEGLYKYVDNGEGKATLAPGQAVKEPEKVINGDGTVTYRFTLRDGLKWSDGNALTAEDFVYSWQRLVNPATAAEYNYMIDMVVNANEIMQGAKEPSELGINALDDQTLEILLTYDCPYFLEIAAFPATFPVREDIIAKAAEQWTFNPATYISNGPYRMKEWKHNSHLLFEKNPNYYESIKGPPVIRFTLMDDANAAFASFRNGSVDFIDQLIPVDELATLLSSGEVNIANYLGTYFVSFNNQKPPFNDKRVRRAFSLAIDRNYIVKQITQTGERPAQGYVPYGVYDEQGPASDFRETGKAYYSVDEEDYENNIAEAKRLLAEAGYPNGAGFPIVEYLYNTNDRHRVIAEALQNMWSTVLGVKVTLSNQEWNVFIDNRHTKNYSIARHGWIADYNDPISFLDMFITNGGNNDPDYRNSAYDTFITKTKSTSVPAERMRLMHQAEDLLMGDDAVAPVFFYVQPYLLNPQLRGMYYSPLCFFYFTQAEKN